MNSKENLSKTRLPYIEMLRIVAAFFVIFNHTGGEGYFLFSQYQSSTIRFWLYLFLSIFCKFAVPLFFIISGGLLCGKEEVLSVEKVVKKLLRIMFLLLTYSLIYYYVEMMCVEGTYGVKDFLIKLYSVRVKSHLWYLYAYIAYLLSLPLLNVMVRSLDTKYYYYILGLHFIFSGLLPVGEYLLGLDGYSIYSEIKPLWLLQDCIFYPCIGYFLQHRISYEKVGRRLLILWGLDVVCIFLSCYMTYYKSAKTGVLNEMESQSFHTSFVFLNSIVIFLSCKYFFSKRNINKRVERCILSLGGVH